MASTSSVTHDDNGSRQEAHEEEEADEGDELWEDAEEDMHVDSDGHLPTCEPQASNDDSSSQHSQPSSSTTPSAPLPSQAVGPAAGMIKSAADADLLTDKSHAEAERKMWESLTFVMVSTSTKYILTMT